MHLTISSASLAAAFVTIPSNHTIVLALDVEYNAEIENLEHDKHQAQGEECSFVVSSKLLRGYGSDTGILGCTDPTAVCVEDKLSSLGGRCASSLIVSRMLQDTQPCNAKCTGTNACQNLTQDFIDNNIGDKSCCGKYACAYITGNTTIGPNSCLGYAACYKAKDVEVALEIRFKVRIRSISMDTPVAFCKVSWATTAVTSIPPAFKKMARTLNSMSETTHAEIRLHARILVAPLEMVVDAICDFAFFHLCAVAKTANPTGAPTTSPSQTPSTSPIQPLTPTTSPSKAPSASPTTAPSTSPSQAPTTAPSASPSQAPTTAPSTSPSQAPMAAPKAPTQSPSKAPSASPNNAPSASPSKSPIKSPTKSPSQAPTKSPSVSPTVTSQPSTSLSPTKAPTRVPTKSPVKEVPPTTASPVSEPGKGGKTPKPGNKSGKDSKGGKDSKKSKGSKKPKKPKDAKKKDAKAKDSKNVT
eukprot:scaffold33146_cov63-Cyclotella_meneghiniana.AAC.5